MEPRGSPYHARDLSEHMLRDSRTPRPPDVWEHPDEVIALALAFIALSLASANATHRYRHHWRHHTSMEARTTRTARREARLH
jgi:hypothetical protein